MDSSLNWLHYLYLLPFLLIWLLFVRHSQNKQKAALSTLQDTTNAGLTEPLSLHPAIDPLKCVGSGGCVSACPEGAVIGIIDGKASLIDPTRCIGHGACAEACPHQAIALVFGTERRGVDIPLLGADFQTNVPGIYIAGELGGMGLIRNAITQGTQAVEAIASQLEAETSNCSTTSSAVEQRPLDLVIVGAGPAGLAAALAAKKAGLSYRVLEQQSLGGTIANYPRGKLVMTQPAELPLVGKIRFREVSKETLMDFWQSTVDEQELQVSTGHRVERVSQRPHSGASRFIVHTRCRAEQMGESGQSEHQWQANQILLCIGRRGTPRKLGVPGEESPKVVYRLIDPEQYQGKRVLVVGGGDSALEAAIALSEQPGTQVALSYRGKAFNRARNKNREQLTQRLASSDTANQGIQLFLESNVTRLEDVSQALRVELSLAAVETTSNPSAVNPSAVTSSNTDRVKPGAVKTDPLKPDTRQTETLEVDTLIVAAGGILPTAFLEQLGIQVDTRYGTA